jgi:diadenosine tetraphosphate (Ap4A) HIT family hydrolase
MFVLDHRLEQDTVDCGAFELCRLLLMNDSRYPWFILVPRYPEITEIHHLPDDCRDRLWRESARLSAWMERSFSFDKLNVGALGNVVSQLHVHHVGRTVDDPAWPGPVWGHSPARPYEAAALEEIRALVDESLFG